MYHSKKVITEAVLDMETMKIVSVKGYEYCGPWDLAEGDGSQSSGTPNEGADGNDDHGQDEYFLSVDDRTRYKTSEEAIKGFQESGRRIAELTPWQQQAQEYGLRDPRDLAALLDELIDYRAKAGSQARGAESQQTKPAAGGAGDGSNVTPEQKQAVEWLSKHGVEAGLVSKQELAELKETLETLRESAQVSDEERFERRIDEGRGYLKAELQEMGIKLPENKEAAEGLLGLLEDALTNWANLDDNRVAAFYQGGDVLKQLIKDGLSTRAVVLNILKNQPAANYAAQKQNTQTQNRRATQVATKPGTKTQTQNQTQNNKKNRLDTGEDFTPDIHERAFELLQSVRSGN